MPSTKKIIMNPNLLIPEEKKKKKKRKQKPNIYNIKPNKVQTELIRRVREVRQTRKRNHDAEPPNENPKPNDFHSSLQYLNDIIKKKQQKKELKRQRKAVRREERLKRREEHRQKKRRNVTVKITRNDDPPYGNLKNGNKPTYSQYKQKIQANFKTPATPHHTQQRHSQIYPPTPMQPRPSTPVHVERIIPKIIEPAAVTIAETVTIDAPRIKRKRRRKRYTLGKKDRVVGILIKNKKTRKRIEREHKNLKKIPIKNIKLYLKKHGLIKVGSVAPDHVLRNIYETAILSGDVFNIKNQIHNFLSK